MFTCGQGSGGTKPIFSLTDSFFDAALATIWPFRLPPELMLGLKYGQKILEWIILHKELGH